MASYALLKLIGRGSNVQREAECLFTGVLVGLSVVLVRRGRRSGPGTHRYTHTHCHLLARLSRRELRTTRPKSAGSEERAARTRSALGTTDIVLGRAFYRGRPLPRGLSGVGGRCVRWGGAAGRPGSRGDGRAATWRPNALHSPKSLAGATSLQDSSPMD